MSPHYLVFGNLTREFLLPPSGSPRLDVPGGSLLYAGAGARVWVDESDVGLVGRVGDDYPRAWLNDVRGRGFDTAGVKILPQNLDVREFLSYSESFEPNPANPVTQFARRELTVPKSLFGYQPPEERAGQEASRLVVTDIPEEYLSARAALICPMDLSTQNQLIAGLKRGNTHTILLAPSSVDMKPKAKRTLPVFLSGVTALLISQDELRGLFWGETHDLWEMAEAVSLYGCEYVAIKCGAQGQLLYAAGVKKRYEIPAYPSRLADLTGAGHVFNGGFLAGYCKNYDPLEGVFYGSVSASLKLEGSGAFYPLDVLPGLAEARLNVVKGLTREV
ncbi:MAG TPA: carbohydrate kinase family protein [Anaerolineales bacterium]|nr:carbohydrate kinase family protein [Anaerolineales bacterium]